MKHLKFLFLIFVLNSWNTNVDAETLDHIVAVVNDSVITQSQLNQKMQFANQQAQASGDTKMSEAVLRKQVLQHMIDTELELQVAKKMGIKINDNDVTNAISDIAKRNGFTLETFKTKLQESGISYTAYRQQIQEQMITAQVAERQAASKIVITEKEINNTANKLRNQPLATTNNVQYHLEDLLIELPKQPTSEQINTAKQQAQTLLQKAQAGMSFQEIVKTAPAENVVSGNDLGWRPLEGLPEVFVSAVKNLKPGEISKPILAPNGFHLVKLIATQGDNANTVATTTNVSTHVRHILIRTTPLTNDAQVRQRLIEIRADIARGGDFSKLAQQYSQDPGSAAKGGDLDWMESGMLDPQFESAMNQLKPGQISEPIKTQFGWHLIQVLERKTSKSNQGYFKHQAQQMLYQQKLQEATKAWLEQLRKQSYIKIMP